MSRYDVVVVGAGPSGAVAAREAVRGGARTLILERDDVPRSRICGEYLCPGAVERLRRLGYGPVLRAARTTPLDGIRLFAPSGREVRTVFPDGRPGLSVRRCEFDPLLAEAAGAELCRGARVAKLRVLDREVEIDLASGERFRAGAVVGADGRSGPVARQAGLRLGARSERAALHAYYVGVVGSGPYGEMHLPGDGTYLGLNPGADGRVNVTYVTDLPALGADLRSRADALLGDALRGIPSLAARFEDARPHGPARVLSPLEVRVRAVARGRVLLAGDAAGFLDPLTGEGLFGAVVSGALAGRWAARTAVAADPRRCAREYAREHRRALGRKVLLNLAFQSLLRRPRLLELLGRRFARNRGLADALIGVIGNVRGPRELLRVRHLLALAGVSA